jgi:hypothetical protein
MQMQYKRKVRVFIFKQKLILFILEKPNEVPKVPILAKNSTVVYRNKNGQFLSPSRGVKPANTVSSNLSYYTN